jgi:hypothetical protein
MSSVVKVIDFFGFSASCCKIFGLKLFNDGSESRRQRRARKIYFWCFVVSITLTAVSSFGGFIENFQNVEIATMNLTGVLISLLSVTKALTLYLKQDEIENLIGDIDAMFPKTAIDQKNLGVDQIHGRIKRNSRICFGMLMSIVVIYTPGFFVNMILNKSFAEKLPGENLWFPFDEYNLVAYPFVLIWELFVSSTIYGPILAVDFIFVGLITTICIVYKDLCGQMKMMRNEEDEKCRKKTVEIVNLHNNTFEIIEKLNKIFVQSLSISFYGSSCMICVTAYQIFDGTTSRNSIAFGGLAMFLLVHNLLPCYFGSKLQSANEKLAVTAYMSGWNDKSDNEVKKMIGLIMLRSQNPPALKAMKIGTVSLVSYGAVSGFNWNSKLVAF